MHEAELNITSAPRAAIDAIIPLVQALGGDLPTVTDEYFGSFYKLNR